MTVRGWHFCEDRLGSPVLRDGSPCPTIGAIEVFDGEPFMCKSGLHWSARAIDALQYAPGPWVRLVEGEPTETADDKVVGRKRRTIAGPVNADRALRGFAALCALRELNRYASSATRDACLPAVRCALAYWRTGVWLEDRYAARAAALDAARDAAWDSARTADLAADWASAQDAARNAERDWQNRLLEAMLAKALEVRQ